MRQKLVRPRPGLHVLAVTDSRNCPHISCIQGDSAGTATISVEMPDTLSAMYACTPLAHVQSLIPTHWNHSENGVHNFIPGVHNALANDEQNQPSHASKGQVRTHILKGPRVVLCCRTPRVSTPPTKIGSFVSTFTRAKDYLVASATASGALGYVRRW